MTGGDAARLYQRLGWVRVGDIPGYALMPRGEICSTTVFYRWLDLDFYQLILDTPACPVEE